MSVFAVHVLHLRTHRIAQNVPHEAAQQFIRVVSAFQAGFSVVLENIDAVLIAQSLVRVAKTPNFTESGAVQPVLRLSHKHSMECVTLNWNRQSARLPEKNGRDLPECQTLPYQRSFYVMSQAPDSSVLLTNDSSIWLPQEKVYSYELLRSW